MWPGIRTKVRVKGGLEGEDLPEEIRELGSSLGLQGGCGEEVPNPTL